ncbi:MAG: putative RND superfamily exporter protein [Phenylobacterium sp.]|jgi:predicted RND superfamily exporter protein
MNYRAILRYVVDKPKVIYAAVLLMVLASVAMLPMLQIDTDPENMLNADNPARLFHNQVKQDFVMHDMIVVGAVARGSIFTPQSLGAIATLSAQILDIDGVIKADVLSLSVVDNISQQDDGSIRFDWLMQQPPNSVQGSLALEQAVKRLPMLDNTLVSGDGQAIAIYVPIQSKDQSYAIAEQIRQITAQLDPSLDYHITGLPIAEDQFGYEMFVQMGIAAPLAGLAIFILLWFFFRNLALIIAPMIVAMATVIIIMGALIGSGFTVHIMSSMIAIFLMPIAVVDSVHILSEFADRFNADDDPKIVVKSVMGHLFTPMLYTSVTSAVGFYALMLTPIPPVRVFGFFIGSGILLAFVLTITFIPAYIARLNAKTRVKLQVATQRMAQNGLLSGLLKKLGAFVSANSKTRVRLILVVFIAVFGLSLQGITRIEINDNPVNWFKADHQIRIADKVLNQHFAGTYDAWLVFEGKSEQDNKTTEHFLTRFAAAKAAGFSADELESYINRYQQQHHQQQHHQQQQRTDFFTPPLLILLDDLSFAASDDTFSSELYDIVRAQLMAKQIFMQPSLLNWMADLQQQLVATGLVGKANGLVDIVRTVNRELHSGEAKDFVIADTNNGVAQTLLQYQSSHRPQDLWHFVSKDSSKSLLWLQLTSGDNQHTTKVVNWVEHYIAQNPPPIAINTRWAGKSYLNTVWQDAMVSGMVNSLMSSFVVVFLMMVLLFRSVKYGILAMLPLTMTISLIYGLIGWAGKAYDMPIAVLSALTLGLSIDFAIHFLQRVRELEQQSGSLSLALTAMFQEPSRAISRNAIVIAVGFTPLLLSPLVPYVTVGFFLATIMATSALVTLVLLPTLLTFFRANPTKLTNKSRRFK